MGVMRRSSGIAAILSKQSKEKVSYCQNCLNVNVLSPLKHRIYLDENGNIISPATDADKWMQCWQCGLIVAAYEVKQEAELMTLKEPGDNPFKFTGSARSVGEIRKFDRTGKRQHKKKFKQDLTEYKEEDIKEALRKGATLVSYRET
jgi:hypothetical protein